jgi:hypothetical protein
MEVPTAAEVRSPVDLLLHLEITNGYMFAKFVGTAVSPNTPPEARAIDFDNALGYHGDTPAQTLAYMDGEGAGPEGHVAAAFAGYYDTVTPGTLTVIE